MSIQKIKFKNYKSFEQEQVFEIKPITIVIGKNNSGKTALIQLPLMLSAWMEDRNGILSNSFNGVEFAKQMKELSFNHNKESVLEISFTLDSDVEAVVKIQFLGDDSGISYLEWKYKNKTIWKAEKNGNKYSITIQEAKTEYVASLDKIISGILPIEDIFLEEYEYINSDEEGNEYPGYHQVFLSDYVNLNIQYFSGIRHIFPDANLSFNDLKYRIHDSKGEFAAHFLYKHSNVLADVKKWYIENMDGWGIDLEKNLHNEGFYLYLEDCKKENGQKIPITQTGQGITQVLPLVTTSFMDKMIRKTGGMFVRFRRLDTIIEQPELHIHPAAHGNLVELFAESAIESSNNYILETHSEVMLLRIRRLVAEGKLKPEQVAIYWVDTEEGETGKRSFLKKIEVDEEGNLDDWPAGIFSEDYNELMHIRKARKK